MLAIKSKALTDSFLAFATEASQILHIKTTEDYEYAMEMIEYLFEEARDSHDDPLNDLITILSKSIEKYESEQEELIKFEQIAQEIDPCISILRTIMKQHNLTISDFKKEIGAKSLVSMILNGQRNLTKDHISKLSREFQISPSLFF